MLFRGILVILLLCEYGTSAEIDKQYASLPNIFHLDNYDNCMLLGDEALYCFINYVLEPIDQSKPTELWSYIKNISSIKTNYRHDIIRHGVCIPKTCPEVKQSSDNDPLLKKQIEDCYNKKFRQLELMGNIAEIDCKTGSYSIDWLDISCGIMAIAYLLLVIYATCYDGFARYKTSDEYQKLILTPKGRVLSAFSLTSNWIRLTTIKNTPEVKKLRGIQGIRFYNSALVLLSHSILGFICSPVSNTKLAEMFPEKPEAFFFGSSHICLTTFLFISAFLLSNDLFKNMKDRKGLSFQMVIGIFLARQFRLLPTIIFMVLLHATWLRHMGDGPVWEIIITDTEFKNCRANGWTNLLFINNIVNQDQMCLGTSWYIALSTQYFVMSLLFIWLLKKYEKYFLYLVGTAVLIQMTGTFLQNYHYDFPCFTSFEVETFFGLKTFLASDTFQVKIGSFIGNMAGEIMGIAFGYYYYKLQSQKNYVGLFTTKFRVFMFWINFLVALSCLVVPAAVITFYSSKHDAFWASTYTALSRPIFAFCLGIFIIGLSEGVGWLALHVCQWSPTYILGRLTYSVYMVHMSIVMYTPATIRSPRFISNFNILNQFFGDLVAVYLAALLLTLFVELPVSALQKQIFVQREEKKVNNLKSD